MSVYIVRDLLILHRLMKEVVKKTRVNATVSDIQDVGGHKRFSFTVEGLEAKLDIYQRKDGATTFKPTGKNLHISGLLKCKLEECSYSSTTETKSFTMNIGEEWIKVTINHMMFFVKTTNGSYNVINDANAQNIHSFVSCIGDKLTITERKGGRLSVQGKPLYLYNEFVMFVSKLPTVNIEEIIAVTREFVSDRVTDATSARTKMKTLMPIAYNSGVIDETIWKVFSPSMALMDIDIEMEDYSCCMFPALRALEGYLLFLLNEIGEVIDKHHVIGNIFKEDPLNPNQFVMCKKEAIKNANLKGTQYKNVLEKIYTYFYQHRHVSFHMDQICINTKLIETKQEAIDTVNDMTNLIESTFTATHP